MKNRLENYEAFEAHANIDYCYYAMFELVKRTKTKTGIDILIDKATGRTELEIQAAKKCAIILLEQIIESKKVINADYESDQLTLNKIKNMSINNE